jgi:hypothetical protein
MTGSQKINKKQQWPMVLGENNDDFYLLWIYIIFKKGR